MLALAPPDAANRNGVWRLASSAGPTPRRLQGRSHCTSELSPGSTRGGRQSVLRVIVRSVPPLRDWESSHSHHSTIPTRLSFSYRPSRSASAFFNRARRSFLESVHAQGNPWSWQAITSSAGRCCMKTLWGGALLVTLRRSHTTGMKSKVHPTYKTKYRVANWPAYNQALVRRGDVTVWLSSEAIAAWTPRRSGRRGGQRRYSDLAIETALTLRLLYHLPLRQAEGFLHALFGMMRLDLSAPDYTTLSRRSQHLRRRLRPVPPDEGIHLVLDSTGLSIVGEGEWAAAKHSGRGRRGWKKLYLGVDQSGVIRVHTLTEETGDDATTALDLLTAVEGPLVRVTADAAYDTVAVYETAGARGATVVVPPARTANASGHGLRSPARDRTITLVKTLGRRQWKKASGYHRQSRVENTFFRYKSIIGDGLRARSPAGQGSEVVLGCEILNRMTALGRPASYRIGR